MNLGKFSLEGKVAAVTGANTGIGQAICVALAESGAKIVGVARRDCDETQKMVEEAGSVFTWVKADLLEPKNAKKVIADVIDCYGTLDILVNNAGIIRRNNAEVYEEQDWFDVINTNLNTLFFLSQEAGKYWIDNGIKGKIVSTASLLAYQGGIRVPAYTATKHAVSGLTKALCNDWAKYGICCNAIAPGYVISNNTKALVEDQARYQAILERIPNGRWAQPSDIAGAVAFLSSPAADYVNGITLPVDGGWLAR